MTDFSKVEWNNTAVEVGWTEEEQLVTVEYSASLSGAVPTFVFTVANGQRGGALLTANFHTGTSNQSTTLEDITADFVDDNITLGDLVVNETDGGARWEVIDVVSVTELTLRLLTSGGEDDDWDFDDIYTITKRNRLDIYIPKLTEIRVTGRALNKVYFRGRVIEAESERGFGEALRVTVVGYDAELRDGQSFFNYEAGFARSEIVRKAPTERHDGSDLAGGTGEDTGMFTFPHVSFFEGQNGIQHSMNQQTVSPDFHQASRNHLPEILDMAREDQWAPSAFLEPSIPAITQGSSDGSEELVFPSAQGNLAQSFTPTVHTLVSQVELHLSRVLSNIAGNIYVRIEANSVGADASREDIPSGELVSPWAESLLLNISNLPLDASGPTDEKFTFPQPVALSSGSKYWIVLSYQESTAVTIGYAAGTDFVKWYDNSAGGLANANQAKYASNVWVATTGVDFRFNVIPHTDAWWFYDVSGDAWEDQTTEAGGGGSLDFLDLLTPGTGVAGDRLYIRTAGPIRGLDLVISTIADGVYGDFIVRYFGDTKAKVTGTHTGAQSSTIVTDSDKDFRRTSVVVGDIIRNISSGGYSVISAITQTTLTVTELLSGGDANFDVGDLYEVINLETVDGGAATSGTSTELTDSGGDFIVDGVREGDVIVNVTDGHAAIITAYTTTTITSVGDMQWGLDDVYLIISRWRTVTLKSQPSMEVVATVRMEWEIDSDWSPAVLEAGFPEASSTGFANVADMAGYWISIQALAQPATQAILSSVIPIPGHGYSLVVDASTHDDVILFVGAHSPGSGTDLIDAGENFIVDHGILLGDTVENITDGSTGVITGFATSTAGTTLNDTIIAALSGGGSNDWQTAEIYRIARTRNRLNYFRNGSRPVGGPGSEGLVLRQNGPASMQVWPLLTPQFSNSHRSGVNRIRVIGQTTATPPVVVQIVVNDLEAQLAQKEVIVKTITDYSLHSTAEVTDRANSEIARLGYTVQRGSVLVFQIPYHNRVARRLGWVVAGLLLRSELDGNSFSEYAHDGSSGATALEDSAINFKRWGIEVGDLLINITDGSETTITAISMTTNENDTLAGTLIGGTDNDWDAADLYKIERRTYVRVGDLVRAKAEDPDFIDDDYLVTSIEYREPEFDMTLRLSKNFQAPGLGDVVTMAELLSGWRDESRMGLQRGTQQ